ncbi:hypothetical protein FB192DRAFT_1377251 [Mucor lusitanicus]|uniref:Uncharacterized protein n=1 Tax=Mucor circinelloides f. lusitanicus TaxID=29924 RepID=A0A8H4F280_MUCCL|nr:hypothetical protein FB192DRAFT_1377251 [Mucor lusitanicus]
MSTATTIKHQLHITNAVPASILLHFLVIQSMAYAINLLIVFERMSVEKEMFSLVHLNDKFEGSWMVFHKAKWHLQKMC